MEGIARNILLVVDDDLCLACDPCNAGSVCRGKAFRRFERSENPFIDMSRCWGCMECIVECPHRAVVRHTYGKD
jgi:Pyruvate/2-oxoacid:ferredoxin oxidoreductase delta subunit